MPKIDLSKIETIIRDVAAVEIMPRFRKLAASDVEMKGVNDPVTVADKESERRLTEQLTSYLPGSVVVGEESFARDKAIMAHVDAEHPVWVIDPIDGTRNFVAGVPEFAVMVALVDKRRTIASWIHDPNSGDTVMAEQGGGVWLRGKRLKLAAADPAIPTVGLVGSRVKKLISDPSLMPQGGDLPKIEIGSCAGFDYPRLFTGEVSFANSPLPRAGFLFYRHTNAWDHVPGLFLHHAAGGYSADWLGKPYDMTNARSGLLFASDEATWRRLHKLFEPLMQHTIQKAL
ncbi:MAG: inositol monophosphatase family protein [Alphaproteobacteria bacterium]|nr:inositol monophosphatase family protein [Alphaproteobacteria bacterium]